MAALASVLALFLYIVLFIVFFNRFEVLSIVFCCVACSALYLVGTSRRSNVFRVAANDLLYITDIILDIPAATANETVTVIINVMYEEDYTGPYADPSGTLDVDKVPAVSVNMVAFGLGGMFNDPTVVPHIIWNFPFATSLNMSYVGFRGSILAPNAGMSALHVNSVSVTFYGFSAL